MNISQFEISGKVFSNLWKILGIFLCYSPFTTKIKIFSSSQSVSFKFLLMVLEKSNVNSISFENVLFPDSTPTQFLNAFTKCPLANELKFISCGFSSVLAEIFFKLHQSFSNIQTMVISSETFPPYPFLSSLFDFVKEA
jgi:hypothetical protein